MKLPRSILPFSVMLALGLCLTIPAHGKLPAWIKTASQADTSFYQDNETMVITLVDEEEIEVKENGTFVRRIRKAYKILNPKGREVAIAKVRYYEKSMKVKLAEAWIVTPSGKAEKVKGKYVSDRPLNRYSVYSDHREKSIDARQLISVDHIFAFEAVTEAKTVFTQERWFFESRFPVLKSRLAVTLAPGWDLRYRLKHGAPEPIISDRKYVWEMSELAPKKSEPRAPSNSIDLSSIYLDFVSEAAKQSRYSNWEVDHWGNIIERLRKPYTEKAKVTPEIHQKALELSAEAENEKEKIRLISEYVMNTNYASIQLDLGKGGGYIPRLASETFTTGYGDCKDKTTLLCSMLSAIGIDSYPVILNAIDSHIVDPEWAYTGYFNHCILGVDTTFWAETPAYLNNTPAGNLLFIDPTSKITPLGQLPSRSQGGFSMVLKQGVKDLIRIPHAAPEDNLNSTTIEAELFPDGSLLAILQHKLIGKEADRMRYTFRDGNLEKFTERRNEFIARSTGPAQLKVHSVDEQSADDSSFQYSAAVGVRQFAKNFRNRLLVFNPGILTRVHGLPFNDEERTLPIIFEPELFHDIVSTFIPEGFVIDELPEVVEIKKPFGSYQSSVHVDGDKVIFERSLRYENVIVDAEDFEDIKAFYLSASEADALPVVLKRES